MKNSDSQKPDSSLISIDSETDYVPKRKVSALKPSKVCAIAFLTVL
jgi:hypothetical protein